VIKPERIASVVPPAPIAVPVYRAVKQGPPAPMAAAPSPGGGSGLLGTGGGLSMGLGIKPKYVWPGDAR